MSSRNPTKKRSKRKTGAELTAEQLELLVPILFAGIVWGFGLKETITSKYVTASRACHVTIPRVFPIGQGYGAFDTLSSLYTRICVRSVGVKF